MFRLDGKVALITGAGQNIGAGIARLMGAQGATVMVNDYYADRAERTVAQIVTAGGVAHAVPFDVTDLEAVTAAFSDIKSRFGPVDILVNNAGTAGPGETQRMAPFSKTPPDYWATLINANLYGMLNCCKAAIDDMIDRGWGRIITISSGAAQRGMDVGTSVYAGAKAGQNGFMRHLAMENAQYGVTCNTIGMGLATDNPAPIQYLVDQIPVKRIGTPEDPGYLAVYLASPEASFITGQTIGMNGGSLMI